MSYTNGPWLFDYGDIGETEDVRYADIHTHDGIIIAEVNDCIPEFVNNGHLIKAAPHLIEALQGVLHHNSAVKPQYQLPSSLIRQIDAAIAAAQVENHIADAGTMVNIERKD